MAEESGSATNEQTVESEVTFTDEQQSKVDELIGKRLEREAAKNQDAINQAVAKAKEQWQAEVEENAKLSKMTDAQKQEHDQQKQNEALEAANAEKETLKQELNHLNMVNAASSLLADKGVVADEATLKFVVREDADATQEAVEDFVKLVEDKAEAKRQETLKGSTPKIGTGNGGQSKSFGALAAERVNQQNNADVADDFFGIKK